MSLITADQLDVNHLCAVLYSVHHVETVEQKCSRREANGDTDMYKVCECLRLLQLSLTLLGPPVASNAPSARCAVAEGMHSNTPELNNGIMPPVGCAVGKHLKDCSCTCVYWGVLTLMQPLAVLQGSG